MPTRSPRVPNSIQIFMTCRSIVITLVRSVGPSKQCRQDLTVPPMLKLGLLPFLIVHVSSIPSRTSPPSSESGPSLADQIRTWDQNGLEKMNQRHGRSSGSSDVEVGGGVVRHLGRVEHVECDQLDRERHSRSSHADDGGGSAQQLEHLSFSYAGYPRGVSIWL
jgi:hypothetical protein